MKLNKIEKAIVDVYWSDHCRHTTFLTPLELKNPPSFIKEALDTYNKQRAYVHGEKLSKKPITLMDLATISMKEQKKKGTIPNLVDDVHEQNACTMMVSVKGEPYRISFKNETHNSPTEIVPYDGAATCTGGLQRDLIASRGRPYDGIRITGAADPTAENTLSGKLSQRVITTEAARGYSDYMNGLGLTTGYIHEIYHPDYVAKRMELGFGVSYVKADLVRIEEPTTGDIVILIGGKTGRDGIGGATGSSKQQDEKAVKNNVSQVPVGNPIVEKHIIELYSDPKFLALVKRSNDFGAGGVSVAVGEIADGLDIYLDRVPLKKEHADMEPIEIAISESQERMAVLVAAKDKEEMLKLCKKYKLEATHVADVTDTGFMNMFYKGEKVVSLERKFLNSPALPEAKSVVVTAPDNKQNPFVGEKYKTFKETVMATMSDLENCSQQGLAQKFNQVNKYTVLKPYDGKTGKTRTQGSVCLIPAKGNKSVVTICAQGYDPYVAKWSPFHGGMAARLESMAKIIALGGDYKNIFFTDQEYYASPNTPEKYGAPFAALLGANQISALFGRPAVGGKDSMSGSYKEIDVPPTLVSFAIAEGDIKNVKSQAFQRVGTTVGIIDVTDAKGTVDLKNVKAKWDYFIKLREEGSIVSARALGSAGAIEEIINAALGNKIGFKFNECITPDTITNKNYGSIIFEIKGGTELDLLKVRVLGQTIAEEVVQLGEEKVGLDEILAASEARLASVFPVKK